MRGGSLRSVGARGVMRGLLLPLAGLLTFAGAFGLWLGLRSVPPGESEIIAAQAARYVAETGGAPTDCHAVPAGIEAVRLVVICQAEGAAAWSVAVDARGRVLEPGMWEREAGT